jgi:hypothetical protein
LNKSLRIKKLQHLVAALLFPVCLSGGYSMRSYGAARSLFSMVSFFAWLMIIGGVIGAFVGAGVGGDMARWNRAPEFIGMMLGAVPGVIVSVIGFLGLVTAQMGRSGVDSAEYGQQMLQIARDHLDISRQSLNKADTVRQSFAALPETSGARATASYADTPQPVAAKEVAPTDTPSVIAYKGKEIAALGSAFHFAGLSFDTLADAQAQIDQLVPISTLSAANPS